MEYAVPIVDSLAWPFTVVVLVLLFREPLKSLVLSIARFKYKGLEISFRSTLQTVKSEANKSGIKTIKPQQFKTTN